MRLFARIALSASVIVVAAACGPKSPSGQCAGQERPQLSCESEFKYDGLKLEGGFSGLGIGSLTAKTEQVALRAIDTETERYVAQSKRLCDEYNKCVIDRDQYATRAENLRRRMSKVPELYDGVRVAKDPVEKRKALLAAYDGLVPDEERKDFGLDFGVLAKKPGEGSSRPIHAGDALPTETRVHFQLKMTQPAHVYLFQRTPDGKFNVLFPDSRIGVPNPVPKGTQVTIPPQGSFRLNDKDIGLERVYIVASLAPLTSLQTAVDKLNSGGEAPALKRLDKIAKKGANACSRGLEYEGAPASDCEDERGLEYAPDGDASMRVRAEAADSMIVKVFAFDHTK